MWFSKTLYLYILAAIIPAGKYQDLHILKNPSNKCHYDGTQQQM